MTRRRGQDQRARRASIGAAFVVLAVVAAGCASSGDSGRRSDDPAPDEDQLEDDTFTRVTEVGDAGGGERAPTADAELPVSITDVDTEAGTVTITNHGTDDVDLGAVWICSPPECQELDEPALAGGTSETVTDPFRSSAEAGALALFRSDDPDEPDAILSYVEWGTTGQAGAAVAVEAGVWRGRAVGAGLVLSTGGEYAVDASGWEIVRALPRDGATPPPPRGSVPATTGPATTAPSPDDYDPPSPPPTAPPPAATPPPDDYSPPPPPPAPPPPPPTPPPDDY